MNPYGKLYFTKTENRTQKILNQKIALHCFELTQSFQQKSFFHFAAKKNNHDEKQNKVKEQVKRLI